MSKKIDNTIICKFKNDFEKSSKFIKDSLIVYSEENEASKFLHLAHHYLKESQIPLYRTDELGDVEFEITGSSIKMIQEAGDYKTGRQLLEEINELELTKKM